MCIYDRENSGKMQLVKEMVIHSENISAWCNIATKFMEIEEHLQKLMSIKDRYDISINDNKVIQVIIVSS